MKVVFVARGQKVEVKPVMEEVQCLRCGPAPELQPK